MKLFNEKRYNLTEESRRAGKCDNYFSTMHNQKLKWEALEKIAPGKSPAEALDIYEYESTKLVNRLVEIEIELRSKRGLMRRFGKALVSKGIYQNPLVIYCTFKQLNVSGTIPVNGFETYKKIIKAYEEMADAIQTV